MNGWGALRWSGRLWHGLQHNFLMSQRVIQMMQLSDLYYGQMKECKEIVDIPI
jgi:D-alanyl-lipoteichoic acid acyltransferase DltB (MBOAT superfamily)